MSIYSLDDHTLSSGNYLDLENDRRIELDPQSPAYSESHASGAAERVEPRNLRHALQSPSISSDLSQSSTMKKAGFRAAEAWTRPSPIFTNGSVSNFVFDLLSCTFSLSLTAKARAARDAPTEIYLPDFHFPAAQTMVTASAGEWTIDHCEINTVKLQRLKWWHPEGDQEIKIQGAKYKPGELANGTSDDISYLEQCQRAECVIM